MSLSQLDLFNLKKFPCKTISGQKIYPINCQNATGGDKLRFIIPKNRIINDFIFGANQVYIDGFGNSTDATIVPRMNRNFEKMISELEDIKRKIEDEMSKNER